jgi:selenide,water dikinase
MIDMMTTLNKLGAAISHINGVNAITDVTGFGLIGHLTEITKGAQVSANLYLKDIPTINEIEFYTQQFCYPDITTKNLNAYKNTTEGLNGLEFLLLCDPQTSGGLLITVNEKALPEFLETSKAFDVFNCLHAPIGRIIAPQDKMIYIQQ